MRTIYIITQGDYSEYHVVGYVNTKEEAEEVCKLPIWHGYFTPDYMELEYFDREGDYK